MAAGSAKSALSTLRGASGVAGVVDGRSSFAANALRGCVACQSFFFLITPQTQTMFDFSRIAPGDLHA